MKFEDVLHDIKHNLSRDYVSSGIIGVDGVHLTFDPATPEKTGLLTAAELADVVKDALELVREVKSGRLYYINLTTDKFKVFLFPVGSPPKFFCLLIMKVNGNVGKAILELERAGESLRQELEHNCLV